MRNIVVIGGGASGMMAAIKAAERGNRVTVLERNEKLGKKIFITGKGRCNVTTNKDVEEIIKNIPGNGNFMYSALYTFTNYDLMQMIETKGVKLKIERGDRVFPESDKSSDIIRCFERYLEDNRVNIRYNTRALEIHTENDEVKGVKTCDGDYIPADAVVLATGGKSYPLTGSTGDGYAIAEKLGHKIVDIKPSLVPLVAKEEWIHDLMGLSLKNVSVSMKHRGKEIYSDFGEMLFTHFGISGPIIISGSRYVLDYLPKEIDVYIDLKPALDHGEFDKRILRDFEAAKNKHFKNSLDELLPKKIIPVVINLSGIDPDKPVNSITREERMELIRLIKEFKVTVIDTRPIDEAIITRGGVSVKEVNPGTMESKIIKGLYIVGELLDVDALTGGFNLQVAFSTGYCAGISC